VLAANLIAAEIVAMNFRIPSAIERTMWIINELAAGLAVLRLRLLFQRRSLSG
jgi:hypothetical protein